MLENFTAKFKKMSKKDQADKSKDAAKERLHLVLMQDRAHVSADFLDMMKQEIVDVIKKYIDVDENEMDVKLENKVNEDGTSGAPSLYANIPIVSINEEKKKESEELAKTKQAEEAKKTPIEEKAREIMAKKKKAAEKKLGEKKSAEKISPEKKAELRNAKIEAKKSAEKAKAEAKTVAKQHKKEEKEIATEKKQAQKTTKKETK